MYQNKIGILTSQTLGINVYEYYDLPGEDNTKILENLIKLDRAIKDLDIEGIVPFFEWPADRGLTSMGYYSHVWILKGYFYPPKDGDYIFHLAANKNSKLYLSTNENPNNKKLIIDSGEERTKCPISGFYLSPFVVQ